MKAFGKFGRVIRQRVRVREWQAYVSEHRVLTRDTANSLLGDPTVPKRQQVTFVRAASDAGPLRKSCTIAAIGGHLCETYTPSKPKDSAATGMLRLTCS